MDMRQFTGGGSRAAPLEVEAPTAEDAVELQDDSAAPDASDPSWTTIRSEIMNEKVGPA